jgi:3-isopropylmalate dehydrogenase
MGASHEPARSQPGADARGVRDDSRSRPSYVVAVLPGDGIGPEVTAEARKAVDAAGARLGFGVDWVEFDLGADRYLSTGEVLPDTVLKELGQVDAILLGAVGRPDVPPGVLERGLLLRLRFELDLYVNLRPVKLYPGVASPLAGAGPDDVDLLVVRENTEGAYVGAGGTVHQGTPAEVATEESLNTRHGVERCLRYAAARARERDGVLTLVHKTNVLTHAGGLWARAAREVAGETGVRLEYAHVDAACLHLVTDPGRFDVVVTDNLFGDILTDLGAAIAGGLGTAASANLNPGSQELQGPQRSQGPQSSQRPQGSQRPGAAVGAGAGSASAGSRRSPSLFEPVHGSAPDIAGTGRANPVAAVLSAALLLDHLGEARAAAAVEAAAVAVLPGAGRYSTRELGDQIAVAVGDDVPAPQRDGEREAPPEPTIPTTTR